MSLLAAPATAMAEASQAAPTSGDSQFVSVGRDGSLTLQSTAPPAPPIYGAFKQFGIATLPRQLFTTPFQRIQVNYTANTPAGSAALIDLRASVDGVHWSAWEVDLANGAYATFARPMFFAQYRATLLGDRHARPALSAVQLAPQPSPATFSIMSDDRPVAPTWKLHATRQGMVGAHTSNGHKIKPHDHYVSLPSRRALSPNGTNDYQVRITYNGRSSVAPVYDVGPWNTRDNYWDVQRDMYQDLPRGWPEDHAAYFDHYNGGRAEHGRVRFPTAIDVGDGVWWDDLGIKGDQATVEITFLWLGKDPLEAAPPAEAAPQPAPAPPAEAAPPAPEAPAPAPEAPAPPPPPPAPEAPVPPPAPEAPAPAPPPAPPEAPAPAPPPTPPEAPAPAPPPAPPAPPPPAEISVDDGTAAFHGQAAVKWYDGPGGCGESGHALWTYSTPNPSESENLGRWQPNLTAEGMYDVYVAIPGCGVKKPNTTSARYIIQHRDGATEVVVDQAGRAGTWVLLGRFPFHNGDGGFVELRDVTGDTLKTIWFDAAKWVPVP